MAPRPDDPDRPPAPGPAALRGLPLAVVVVTATDGAVRSCATATATYGALHPPMVVVPLRRTSTTLACVLGAGSFAVSVLDATEVDVAERAGRPGTGDDKPRAVGLDLVDAPHPGGTAAVATTGDVLWCDVATVADAGGYAVVVGTVTATRLGSGVMDRLVRCDRRYHRLGPPLPPSGPEEYPL